MRIFILALGLALCCALSPLTGHAGVLRAKPLANVVRCVTSHQATSCQKFPVWRATHAEYAHWTRTRHARKADGTRLLIRTQFPILRRPPPPQPVRGALIGYFPITAYSYGCGSRMPWQHPTMANGQPPFVGAISSDVLPRGETVLVVADTYSYRGTILDTGQGYGGLDLFTSTCSATYGYTRSSAAVYRSG